MPTQTTTTGPSRDAGAVVPPSMMPTRPVLAPAAEVAWRTGVGDTATSAVQAVLRRAPHAVTGSGAQAWVELDALVGEPATLPLGAVRVLRRGRFTA